MNCTFYRKLKLIIIYVSTIVDSNRSYEYLLVYSIMFVSFVGIFFSLYFTSKWFCLTIDF